MFAGANLTSSDLSDIQFFDPLPAVLRDYSSKVARLGEPAKASPH